MSPVDDAATARLQAWLEAELPAERVRVDRCEALSGGAIQENLSLRLDVDGGPRHGHHHWVLRRDAAATIAESHSRVHEHAVLEAAFDDGVCVAPPVIACADAQVLGVPFSLMGFRAGIGYGPKLVRVPRSDADRERLVERLGEELARIHAIDVERPALAFLGPAPADPVGAQLQGVSDGLDALAVARPVLERALHLARASAPVATGTTLVHRDFRTGNLLVDEHRLSAVLDWEFAGLGDPMSDIGWFCARCWRFSRPDLEAGGLGARATLYRAYARVAGRAVDDAAVRWWELFAHLRWALIALQQGARHDSGAEPSLALALTGRMADTLERDALRTALSLDASRTAIETRAGALADRPVDAPADASADASPADTLPRSHLLPAAADALAPLIDALPREPSMTLRLVVRALRVAASDLGGCDALANAREALLRGTGHPDETALAHAIRAGRHDADGLDALLLAWADLRAAALAP